MNKNLKKIKLKLKKNNELINLIILYNYIV